MNSGASESHVGITVPQQRKPLNPSPVFTPSPNPSPNLPFMPLQLPTSNSSTYSSYFSSSASTSYGFSHEPPVGTFKEEPPLLEELGINTELILKKILSALNPLRISTALHKDADLSGPFVICMALGFLQLLSGKIQFGVITGWTCLASFFVYVVFNMLAGREGNLDLYRCLSVVGVFNAASGIVLCHFSDHSSLWENLHCHGELDCPLVL